MIGRVADLWGLGEDAASRAWATAAPRLFPLFTARACGQAGLDATLSSPDAGGFDQAHYERMAGQRFRSMNAAMYHYLRIGSRVGWEPRASFSPTYYRSRNPDVVAAGYEPFAHYTRFGRYEGRGGCAEEDVSDDEAVSPPSLAAMLARPRPQKEQARVDVVIPVYGNRTLTLQAIDSVLAANVAVPFELIVVDDASPDGTLRAELQQLADAGLVSLLMNDHNVGFVRSANRGLLLHEDRDVVLLNSDTRVFGDWLDRLLAALHATPRIATATPLSNAATILSYPIALRDNPRSGLDFCEMDQVCSRLDAGSVELPTAIGFCMAIKRRCITQIGAFDIANFGRGYGEENDFSRRAASKGWTHVAATNVFVWHRGGGSFGPERDQLIAAAQATLRRLHPGYEALVGEFIAKDPMQPVRAKLDRARLAGDPRPKILYIGKPVPFSTDTLAIRLVPDIGPFEGHRRLIVNSFPPVPNLSRIGDRTPSSVLVELMQDLRIHKVWLPAAADSIPLRRKLVEAAKQIGAQVVLT